MHTETWILHTHPNTSQGPHHIILRGAAVTATVLGRERRKITAMLAGREKQAKVTHTAVHYSTLLPCCILPVHTLVTFTAVAAVYGAD